LREQLSGEASDLLGERAVAALLRDRVDIRALPRLAQAAGARLALLAERRVPPALRALVAVSGGADLGGKGELTGAALLAAVDASDEAKELLRFALSEVFLESLHGKEET
jgi:hypothetical protein